MAQLKQPGARVDTKAAVEVLLSLSTARHSSQRVQMRSSKLLPRKQLNKFDFSDDNGYPDSPILLHTLSPQTLLLATDSSALHIYDLRTNRTFKDAAPQKTYNPHDEYTSSLTSLTPSETSTSGYSRQWFSTGGSTVAITDLRKGVVYQSDDLGEELLSGTVYGNAMIAGGEKGILRIWEGGTKGLMEGTERKVVVEKGESLDVMCSLPENGASEQIIAAGLGDGTVRFVRRRGKRYEVEASVRHNEVEGVMALGFEPGGRMISGGGSIVQVWERSSDEDEQETVQESRNSEDNGVSAHETNESDSDESQDASSEEERKPKRKKRKRNKGKDRGGKSHILAFKGLD
ncbi:MAG: hypothetical protein Q9222_007085 [Ikaeria aurantiellina]